MTKTEFFEMVIEFAERDGFEPNRICAFTGKYLECPQWSIVDEFNSYKEIDNLLLMTELDFATILL